MSNQSASGAPLSSEGDTAPGTPAMSEAEPRLFDEFDAPAYETWRTATVASLKGLPFEKLMTRTYEGIDLQPLYRAEDAADLAHVHTIPGAPPFVRGIGAAGYLQEPWAIAQEISAATPAEFNRRLLHDLNRGQNAVNLILAADVAREDGVGLTVTNVADMSAALADVDLSAVPIMLGGGLDALPAFALLAASQPSVEALSGALDNDPLGELADIGTLPVSLDALYDEMAALTQWAMDRAPALRTISVRGDRYQSAGAHAVTELAAVLATGVAYLRALQARGISINDAAARMTFVFGLGSNFFMEVAKLRAARMLWSQIVAAFGGDKAAQRMVIHARTAESNKSGYDPYVNMLRVTTETLAGAVAGVQSMHVAPFDAVQRPADEFSARIARNTQLILREECNLARLIDPAGGSWYVERVTDDLARSAWQSFQAMEAAGGMEAALAAGSPQAEVAATAAQRVANLATRKEVMVGTNMYPNLLEQRLARREVGAEDKNKDNAEPEVENPNIDGGSGAEIVAQLIEAAAAGVSLGQLRKALRQGKAVGQTVTPLAAVRIAALFETLRAAADDYAAAKGAAPRVFLANMGPLKQHKARADFAQGFLNVGGFVCDYPPGFDSVDAAASAALASGAQAVVICSTDDAYPDIVPPLTAQIKAAQPDLPVLLAGYPPEDVEAFRAAGVDEFIHLRADCYAVNAWLQGQAHIT